MIHPQAIVDPGAQIGKNVRIGAFSVIGPGVEIDDATWIGPHVVINGPTRIGKNNRIYQFSSLGEAPQHLGYQGEPTRLEIGDRNIIREYCTFNRGTAAGGGVTRLGDDNFIMAYCHVAHHCEIGNRVIMANNAMLAGHVIVEDFANIGGMSLTTAVSAIARFSPMAPVWRDTPLSRIMSFSAGSRWSINFAAWARTP